MPGTTNNAIPIKNNTKAIPANLNPLFCSAVKSANVSVTAPLYLPNFGSTINSVTIVPKIVIRNVDAIIKYQLSVIPTVVVASAILAASVLIPDNKASVDPTIRLALNPPDTPAKAAAIPANGCLPKLINTTAPKGIKTTYPASDAILDITPAKTTTRVINLLGVLLTSFVKQAPINPDPSATPTPIIATSTVPNGANPVKFVTAEVNIYLIPSGLSKLTIDEDISFISFVALSNPV